MGMDTNGLKNGRLWYRSRDTYCRLFPKQIQINIDDIVAGFFIETDLLVQCLTVVPVGHSTLEPTWVREAKTLAKGQPLQTVNIRHWST